MTAPSSLQSTQCHIYSVQRVAQQNNQSVNLIRMWPCVFPLLLPNECTLDSPPTWNAPAEAPNTRKFLERLLISQPPRHLFALSVSTTYCQCFFLLQSQEPKHLAGYPSHPERFYTIVIYWFNHRPWWTTKSKITLPNHNVSHFLKDPSGSHMLD